MDATTQHQVGVRAEFTGDARRFFRIALIGNLLQIPTFGFYRFWLITDLRRHLWSHTRLGGDAFEYTGRARELLIGFLIAMAILVPLYVAYFVLSIEAERWQAFASFPLLLIIYILMLYGSFRARRYRATRTIFRGVRFWMTGSGWAYAGRAILWDMLTVITLGLALPWRVAALERYKMRNTRFGDLNGGFAGTGWTLFKRGWWLWLLSIVAAIGMTIVPAIFVRMSMLDETVAMQTLSLVPLTLIIGAFAIVYPVFRAIQMRWWLGGIQFGDVFLASDLRKRRVFWCYIKASLAIFVFSIICTIALLGLLLASGLGTDVPTPMAWQMVTTSPGGFAIVAAVYLVAILGISVIILQFVTRGVWKLAAESATVFNIAALDAATARGMAAGSLGEGLADALDFGGGLGV